MLLPRAAKLRVEPRPSSFSYNIDGASSLDICQALLYQHAQVGYRLTISQICFVHYLQDVRPLCLVIEDRKDADVQRDKLGMFNSIIACIKSL